MRPPSCLFRVVYGQPFQARASLFRVPTLNRVGNIMLWGFLRFSPFDAPLKGSFVYWMLVFRTCLEDGRVANAACVWRWCVELILSSARAKCDFLLADASGHCASYAKVLCWFRFAYCAAHHSETVQFVFNTLVPKSKLWPLRCWCFRISKLVDFHKAF